MRIGGALSPTEQATQGEATKKWEQSTVDTLRREMEAAIAGLQGHSQRARIRLGPTQIVVLATRARGNRRMSVRS